MAKQPNLGQITSPVFSVNQLNQAYTKIDAAFENTLSLDGSTPNAMLADLDLNSNDIINAGVVYGQSIDVASATIGGKLFTGTITWRSDWETGISYQNLDVVRYNGDLYICLEEHTSGTFSSDLSTDKWELFVENTVGPAGPAGADGNDGATGPAGDDGADGQGVPVGGTTGQVLAKIDGTDYNTEWVDQSGGAGVTDGDKGDITVSSSGTVWTIDNGVVTLSKMANMATDSFLGRDTAGTGAPEVLSAATARTILNVANGATANSADATLLARANHTGTQTASTISDFATAVAATAAVTANTAKVTNATHTGDVTGATALTIANDVVTNAKLANMATATLKGRATAGTGDPEDLTATQVRTLINVADGATANSADATLLARSNHTGTQTASTISDFSEAVDDRVSSLLVAGTNVTLTYNDGANTLTIDAAGGGGGGSGDVVGPASATDNALARFDATTGKLIQDSSATLDDNGVLTIPSSTSIPSAPATDTLSLFARKVANRAYLTQIGPSGLDTRFQPHLGGNRVLFVSPTSGTAAPSTVGGNVTTGGTLSFQQSFASSNRWQSTARKRAQSTTTAGQGAGFRQAYANWMRGSAAGFGGFTFQVQVGMSINLNGSQCFVGLCPATGLLGGDPSTDFPVNMCGIGWDAADASTGNWQFFRNDGVGSPVKVDLGATNAARAVDVGWELNMYMAPGGSELFVHIINLNTGATVIDTSYTTDIPSVNSGMCLKCDVRNGAVAAACNIEFGKIYIEADY